MIHFSGVGSKEEGLALIEDLKVDMHLNGTLVSSDPENIHVLVDSGQDGQMRIRGVTLGLALSLWLNAWHRGWNSGVSHRT
jgi:hypothetical protein